MTAGRVGPHRESHEPRLLMHNFLMAGVTPQEGFLEWDGTHGITDWGMDNNGPDPTNPSFMPDGAGNCGIAADDHYNVAKTGDRRLIGTFGRPAFSSLLDCYWAYGMAQGEPGPHPDQGVDNATMLGWLYKLGIIGGYGEVPLTMLDWFTQKFHGAILGLAINGPWACNLFNESPRQPWDIMRHPDGGHDTLGLVTHSDGSGALITWSGVQPYTRRFRLHNITDAWVITDHDDPSVNTPMLDAALQEIHGTFAA